jgi:hypothetical protein
MTAIMYPWLQAPTMLMASLASDAAGHHFSIELMYPSGR